MLRDMPRLWASHLEIVTDKACMTPWPRAFVPYLPGRLRLRNPLAERRAVAQRETRGGCHRPYRGEQGQSLGSQGGGGGSPFLM